MINRRELLIGAGSLSFLTACGARPNDGESNMPSESRTERNTRFASELAALTKLTTDIDRAQLSELAYQYGYLPENRNWMTNTDIGPYIDMSGKERNLPLGPSGESSSPEGNSTYFEYPQDIPYTESLLEGDRSVIVYGSGDTISTMQTGSAQIENFATEYLSGIPVPASLHLNFLPIHYPFQPIGIAGFPTFRGLAMPMGMAGYGYDEEGIKRDAVVVINMNRTGIFAEAVGMTPRETLISVLANEAVGFLGQGNHKAVGMAPNQAYSTIVGYACGFDERYAVPVLGGESYTPAVAILTQEMAQLRQAI